MILGEIMTINIKNISLNYIQYGSGKDIILLHGWGQNIEMMKPLGDKFSDKYRITILDLPGFGKSSEPTDDFGIYDYSDLLHEFISQLKIKDPIIMGHSFGGRVAICYASKYKVDKLVLFGSPCVRTNKKVSLKVKVLKGIIKIPGLKTIGEKAKKHMGSVDYRNASDVMRKVLVRTVNEDLSNCALKIDAPTLLIWGSNDTEAPLEDAKILEKLLKDGGLVVLPNATHYSYLEMLPHIVKILNNFI